MAKKLGRYLNWIGIKTQGKLNSTKSLFTDTVQNSSPVGVNGCVNLGTLRSNNRDGGKNVKKAIGLISKTATLHMHHTFLYISLPSLHDYNIKINA